MKKTTIRYLLAICLMLGLTGCREASHSEPALPVATAPTETVLPTANPTDAATEPSEPLMLERAAEGKVCVSFLSTEIGSWRYAVIPDQEAAVAAYTKAVDAVYSDEWWIKGDKTIGLTVVYNGEFRDFVDSGELVYALGRTKANDARDLYELCIAAARDAGWKEAVTPEQLTGMVSAVLHQGDVEFSLTDPEGLAKLEQLLTAGKFSLGGTGCPFGVLLTITRDSGEELTVALASDGCGVWMSEGNFYEFASDNQPLYDLFGATVPYGTLSAK